MARSLACIKSSRYWYRSFRRRRHSRALSRVFWRRFWSAVVTFLWTWPLRKFLWDPSTKVFFIWVCSTYRKKKLRRDSLYSTYSYCQDQFWNESTRLIKYLMETLYFTVYITLNTVLACQLLEVLYLKIKKNRLKAPIIFRNAIVHINIFVSRKMKHSYIKVTWHYLSPIVFIYFSVCNFESLQWLICINFSALTNKQSILKF